MHLAKGGEACAKEAGGETIGRTNANDAFERGVCVGKLSLARVDRSLHDLGHALKARSGPGRQKTGLAVLEKLGVQRILEARDAARHRCVIDAQLLAGCRNGLMAAYAQEEAQIVPLKATIAITVSHNGLRFPSLRANTG